MKIDESLVNRHVPAHANTSVAICCPDRCRDWMETRYFCEAWNCYVSDKVEIFYVVVNPGSRSLFNRHSYAGKQETLFYFTLKWVQLL